MFLSNSSQIKILDPWYDQAANQYVFKEDYNYGKHRLKVIRIPDDQL